MFAEMKAACLLANAVGKSATAMTAETALEMATLAGARAMNREHELGSIEPGKLADIVLVDMHRNHSVPTHDVVSNLVFSTNNSNVNSVFVGGQKVVDAGKVLGVDEADILQRARERSAVIRQQLGVTTAGAWPVS